ncbi:hypothetical protein RHGRI_010800 [Rhododendron griersonianum]|uniref:Uncharacterized protein n=1 Tax=Rhododendron griersonianum TaxID=479676 RepID=A0AAV6KKV1_9ERIC|nr:hypothetical protein RHGRI_010800 [Rhododendron griersonianum]
MKPSPHSQIHRVQLHQSAPRARNRVRLCSLQRPLPDLHPRPPPHLTQIHRRLPRELKGHPLPRPQVVPHPPGHHPRYLRRDSSRSIRRVVVACRPDLARPRQNCRPKSDEATTHQ